MKIVSKGFVEGFYYKPRVDLQLLEKYHEGIIALSACLAGEVARFLTRGMYEDAKAAALRYQDIFGKGNFFLELQDHGIPEQQNVNQQLLKMHRETGIELVATNDVHYTLAEDAQPHDVLLCLQTGKKLADQDRMRYEGGQYYVKSPEEMERLFPYATEALENTHKIAQRCHVEIEFGVTKLPKFGVPEGYTSWEYLNELCFKGLEERYQPVNEELKERLNYELTTIKNMGYVDYFLIVWDFIKYAVIMISWSDRDVDLQREAWLHIHWASRSLIQFVMICCSSVSSTRNEYPCRILTLTSALNEDRKLLITSEENMAMTVSFRSLRLVHWQREALSGMSDV